MTASVHSGDTLLWRHRLIDQRSKVAGFAGNNRGARHGD